MARCDVAVIIMIFFCVISFFFFFLPKKYKLTLLPFFLYFEVLSRHHKRIYITMLSPLSASSTERARQSWRISQRGRSSSRSMLWMLTRALTEGSHTASCTKTPPCQHSVFTRTQVLRHAVTFNYTDR